MEMLRDRGYLVGDFEINMTEEEFTSKFGMVVKRESLVINKAMRNDTSNQVSPQFSDIRLGVQLLITIFDIILLLFMFGDQMHPFVVRSDI